MGRDVGVGGHRTERIGERIQIELARLIREDLRDPRVGFVTLTGVEVSKDLRHAKVFISVLGDSLEETLAALTHATPFLKRELGRRAGLKHTPGLRFVEDRSIRGARRVEDLLDEIGANAPDPADGDDA
jgi:ribosome-binding factor A